MAPQRQAQIGIILGDFLAERHPPQGDVRLCGRRTPLGPGEQGRQIELVAGAIEADGAPDGTAPVEGERAEGIGPGQAIERRGAHTGAPAQVGEIGVAARALRHQPCHLLLL